MASFSELGEKLKEFYSRASQYIDPAVRFAVSLIVFLWIRSSIGSDNVFSGTGVIVIAALICAVLGSGSIPVAGALFVAADAFGLGIDAGVITCAVLLVSLLLFYRFSEGCGYAAALLPVAVFFGFAPLVPILCGLQKRISSAFAVIAGVIGYYLISALSDFSGTSGTGGTADLLSRSQTLIRSIFSSEMVLMALGLTAVTVLVYSIRCLSANYAFYIAAVSGSVLYLFFVAVGNAVLHTELSFGLALIGAAASCAVSCVLLLVFLPLDFKRSRKLSFEDEDNYYYVKVVPKIRGFEEDGGNEEFEEKGRLFPDRMAGASAEQEEGLKEKLQEVREEPGEKPGEKPGKEETGNDGNRHTENGTEGIPDDLEEKIEKSLEDLNI